MGRHEKFEDDGRTIADMSDVERSPFRKRNRSADEESQIDQDLQADRPWEDRMTPEERRWTALGATKAALTIGLVYLVGLGLVIALLLLVWKVL